MDSEGRSRHRLGESARTAPAVADMTDEPEPTLGLSPTSQDLAALEHVRRQLLVKVVARILATTALLLLVYFQIPIGKTATTWGLVTLLVSLLGFGVVVGFQIRRIVDAPLPQVLPSRPWRPSFRSSSSSSRWST